MRALPCDWSRPIVFCAATPWHGNRMGNQHMAAHLARFAPVLYVDPGVSRLAGFLRRSSAAHARKPLEVVADGVAQFTPPAWPGQNRPGMRRPTDAVVRRAIRGVLRASGARPSAIVVSGLDDVFGAAPGSLRVLYGTDDFVAGAELMGISAGRLERDERARLEEADLVVAASPVLAERWRTLGRDPVLVPNGCDVDTFAAVDAEPWPSDVVLPPPIAGFVGHLSHRIDVSLLEEVARRGNSLLIVGPRQNGFDMTRVDALLALPNVQWVGPRSFEALPAYLRAIDVGLVPYAASGFNRASFPLKVLEYLAAGRGVVSTPLPSVEWLGTDLVSVATGATEFGDAVERAFRGARSSELVAARRELARRHSWRSRAETLAASMGLGNSEAPAPIVDGVHGSSDLRPGRPRTVV
ncbi:MAG: glycosyltransferase [Acidimicrobiia bacterium]|nr:glycosyltransferase [Acidimicrobiia bacterium]